LNNFFESITLGISLMVVFFCPDLGGFDKGYRLWYNFSRF